MTRPPLVIIGSTGGTGGSVIRSALLRLGGYLGREIQNDNVSPLYGDEVNEHGDFIPYARFLDTCVEKILFYTSSLDWDLEDIPSCLANDLVQKTRTIGEKLWNRRPQGIICPLWGWKNPRTVFVLPVLAAAFPEMHFIHLVRDGRDVASSSNRIQMRRHYKNLYGRPPPPVGTADEISAALRFWADTNLQAGACGRRLLGDRYHLLKLEQACRPDPAGLKEVAGLLGLTMSEESAFDFPSVNVDVGSKALARCPEGSKEIEAMRKFGYITGENRKKIASNRPLYYMHINKTGGTSFSSVMIKAFSNDEICPAGLVPQLMNIPISDLGRFRLFTGHFGTGLFSLLGEDVDTVTLLRDPVDRVISQFNAHISNPKSNFYRKIMDLNGDFESCLEDAEISGMLSNYQCRFLAKPLDFTTRSEAFRKYGVQKLLDGRYDSVDLLSSARQRLEKCVVVGILEDFEKSVDWLANFLGINVNSTPRLNVSGESPLYGTIRKITRAELAPRIISRIEDINRLDLALYRHGCRILSRRS